MDHVNQNPELQARDYIDRMLIAAGWVVQDKSAIDFNAALGIAVRGHPTDVGPADYGERFSVCIVKLEQTNDPWQRARFEATLDG